MSALGYKVWVGCLSCYNDGRLVGEWFDAEDAPTSGYEFVERTGIKRCAGFAEEPHEELWVFDFENSPVDTEHSPSQAVEWAGWLKDLHESEYEAFQAYLKLGISDFSEDSVDDFHEKYRGSFSSPAEMAETFAEECGDIDREVRWPYTCIDWERAARELMYDMYEQDGHYFWAN